MVRQTLQMFKPETFRVGEKKTVVLTALQAMRPHRLVIPDTISANFVIEDIRINNVSQMVTSEDDEALGSVPAAAFDSQAIGVAMAFDTATPGVEITLTVRRIPVRSPNWLVLAIRKWLWLDNRQFGSKKKELTLNAAMIATTLD